MKNIYNIYFNIIFLLAFVAIVISGCQRDLEDDATLSTFPKNGEVFIDAFSSGLEYRPFGDSFFEAFSVDTDDTYEGSASMRFDIPNVGNPDGAYAGAIFPDYNGRDLSEFDALTFWAKGSQSGSINTIGFGQDFGENKYLVTLNGLQLSTNWKQYTIPIPDPSKLVQESGLFWYAEGPEDGEGYSFWVDNLQFEKLGTVAQPRPAILNGQDVVERSFIGATIPITDLTQTFNLASGQDVTVTAAPAYYEFVSSNPQVATVNEFGLVTILTEGTSTITATLGGADASGSLEVISLGSFTSAPIPTREASDVISLFSDVYDNVPVDFFNGFWEPFQTTLSADFAVNGDNVLNYTNFNFVGTGFANPTVDASEMTHVHFDFLVPGTLDPLTELKITIRDFGDDGVEGGGDDSDMIATITSDQLAEGAWRQFDIPLTIANKNKLGLIIYENNGTDLTNFYVDNIYFFKDATGGTEPTVGAPTPTHDAADVISIYSDAYTDVAGTDFNPDWGQITVYSELMVAGDNTIKYAGLDFQGTMFASGLDVSSMDFLHIDYWTANSTALNSFLISSGGVETPKALSVPTMGWSSVDIPLGDFSPVDLADVIQMKMDGNGDIYLDNIYFYTEGGGATEPTVAAPTPTHDAGDVISVYSDAYTDVAGTDFNPDWGQTTVYSEVMVAGDNTILYAGLDYQGTMFASSIDVSGMDFLHIDYWTANSTALNTFLISSGGVETPKALTVPTTGWSSVDIPLGDFSPVDLADVIQMKVDGNGDIYLDNIYFYTEGGGATEPTVAAPTPTHDAGDVISVYSDAYTDVAGTDFNPDWGQTTVYSEVMVAGDNTILYAGLDYQGTMFASSIDVSGMDFLHIDYWTSNSTALNTFLISSGGVETPKALTVPTMGWSSVDIPLGDFSPVDLADVIQMKMDGNGDIYLDNIYFYTEGGGATEPTVAAPTPTHDAADVISVYSDAYTDVAGTDFNPNWGQTTMYSEVMVAGNNTILYAGLDYQGTMFASSLDVSGMQFLHIDYWTANSTALNTFLISSGGVETPKALTVPTTGWSSVDIPLGDFSPVDLADVIQMKMDGNGDIYLDNVYFYTQGGGATEPTVAAPTPTHDAGDVISVYSDAYTDVAGTDFNPDWGQTTVYSEVMVAGDNTIMYGGLDYQGTMFASSLDVSGMDFLHIDYWTANSTALNSFLISSGGVETPKALTVPTTGWSSVDIPLGDFSPVDLADVIQMKIDGNGDIYLDNIYFYTEGGGGTEPSLPMTFEDGVNPFIAFDGGAFADTADNPDMAGNSSAKVLQFNKTVGSEWYSGVVFDEALRTTPIIDLADGTVFTFKIWSPNAGIQVRMQLEGGAAPAYEVFQTINTANEWVTLTFDFTSQVNASDTYPRFSIFPDFDMSNPVPVAVESIYYLDDITQQ